MDTTPFWLKTARPPQFPKLERDISVDVLVVGGGITGVTAAYLLQRAGRKVALLDRQRVGGGETGHTTAHVTHVTDARLNELVKTFGRDHALAAWLAGTQAMAQIEANVAAEEIACELRFAPGYLFAAGTADAEAKDLQEEADLAADLGFDAAYVGSAPIVNKPAIRFANQIKFHPQKYLAALIRRVAENGGDVFEQSDVSDFQDSPRKARANGHAIRYEHAIFATHVPLQGQANTASAALFQTKLAAYSTYALGAKLWDPLESTCRHASLSIL